MCRTKENIKFNLIAAVSENMGIGNKGALPWRLKKEMQYFTDMTSHTNDPDKTNVVIMGRKTWESIPPKYKPLPDRQNFVISRQLNYDSGNEDVPVFKSLGEAIERISQSPFSETTEDVWIIGGAMLYEEAMNSPLCDCIYLTRILQYFECDTYFPKIPDNFQEIQVEGVPTEVQNENGISYRFTVLKRPN